MICVALGLLLIAHAAEAAHFSAIHKKFQNTERSLIHKKRSPSKATGEGDAALVASHQGSGAARSSSEEATDEEEHGNDAEEGRDGEDGKEDEEPADSTEASVQRVIQLLDALQHEIEVESGQETAAYDKHMCWCQQEGQSFQSIISAADERIPQLDNDLQETSSAISTLSETVDKQGTLQRESRASLAEATSLSEQETRDFEQKKADLEANLGPLEEAIDALEAGRPGAFLQSSAAAKLRGLVQEQDFQSRASDSDVGSRASSMISAFLDGGQDGSGNLDGVLGVLHQVQEATQADREDLVEKHSKSAAAAEVLRQTKEKAIAAASQLLQEAKSQLGEQQRGKVRLQEDLDATSASLAENKEFVQQLNASCEEVHGEHHRRQVYRGEEVSAAKEAIQILSGTVFDGRMRTASGFQAKLLQISLTQRGSSSIRNGTRSPRLQRRARRPLRSGRGRPGKSAGLVDFRKVRRLIDQSLRAIDTAQRRDDTEYKYCKDQLADAKATTEDLDEALLTLRAGKSEKEEMLLGLGYQIEEILSAVKGLDKFTADLAQQRQAEHAEHVQELLEFRRAMDLLEMARLRLSQHYQGTTFVQREPPRQPSPQKGAAEVLGEGPKSRGRGHTALVLIASVKEDIRKEEEEAEKGERQKQKSYEGMVEKAREDRVALAKDLMGAESFRAGTRVKLHYIQRDADKKQRRRELIITFLAQLHGQCDQLLANYDLHKEARGKEGESLKSARKTLKAATSAG